MAGINQFSPAACCCSPQQCCSWFCVNQPSVPSWINATNDTYGTFKLPLKRSTTSCSYILDTHFDWPGVGSCESGMIPVHLDFGFDPGTFRPAFVITVNCQGFNEFDGLGNFISGVPSTECGTTLVPCLTNNLTFPVSQIGGCGGSFTACFTATYADFTCNVENPWDFAATGIASFLCGGVDPNPLYLLFGNCPPDEPTVSAGWTFSATSFQNIGCSCCTFNCGSCALPKKDLTLDWSGFVSEPDSGSTILQFNGGGASWTSPCILGSGNSFVFGLSCVGAGPLVLTYTELTPLTCQEIPDQGLPSFCATNFEPNLLNVDSFACSPLEFVVSNTSPFPLTCDLLNGEAKIIVSDPNIQPSGASICQDFCASSCQLTSPGANPITVIVSTGASGTGTQLATGTMPTDSTTPCVWLSWQGQEGSYFVTGTAANQFYSQQHQLSCGGTTNLGGVAWDHLCLGSSPPESLNATLVWTINPGQPDQAGPFTCDFTFTRIEPSSADADSYAASLFCPGPFFLDFSFELIVSECQLILNPFEAGLACLTVFGNGSCSPLNIVFSGSVNGNCFVSPGLEYTFTVTVTE